MQQQSDIYWASEKIKFPIRYIEENVQIKYKYAIFSRSPRFSIDYEGNNEKDIRILENIIERFRGRAPLSIQSFVGAARVSAPNITRFLPVTSELRQLFLAY